MNLESVLWRIDVLQKRLIIVSDWQELCWLKLELIDLKYKRDLLMK